MTQLTTPTMMAPQNADQNPSTCIGRCNSSDSQPTSRNSNAFTTNAIRPNVRT